MVEVGQCELKQQVPDKKIKRTFMSVNFSSDYCYCTVKNNDGGYFKSISLENENTTAKFSYKITCTPISTSLRNAGLNNLCQLH